MGGNQATGWRDEVFKGFLNGSYCKVGNWNPSALGVCLCVFVVLIIWSSCRLTRVFSLLSLVPGVSVNRSKDVDMHALSWKGTHLDLSLSLTHTHAGEGRISLRHSSRSGDEWCGRSCRRYGSLLLVAVEGSFLDTVENCFCCCGWGDFGVYVRRYLNRKVRLLGNVLVMHSSELWENSGRVLRFLFLRAGAVCPGV